MRYVHYFKLFVLAFALVAAGFWCGFREGAKVSIMVDAVPRAGISLGYLSNVDQQLTKNTVIGLESDIDLALLWTHSVEEHSLHALFEPLWGLQISQSKQSLQRLARYRLSHLSPLSSQALAKERMPEDPDAEALRMELLADAKRNKQIISTVVAKYTADSQTIR